ncbi:unnamed protein product [Brassicogethes aeneus]|uniref:ATP-dependent DNA helicase n=1 Tax=Brassicogethes aeneus TaxID=1431903 RepID=A0A9P0BGU6_BRAAE|nr:unnamed protein product [Brassicogethes aeneus]
MSDPMVYPILFPKGEYGYDMALRYRNKVITIREFYRYRIQLRQNQFSIIHHGDKLFQQYLVDAWCRAEANILWWYRNNQQQLRVAGKQAIDRMLQARAANENLRVGNVIMLPSNFIGGPRFQSRKYLDAMTVVSRLGPDCITVQVKENDGTVNWDEIRHYLDCRYISAMEACWRLFEFKLGDCTHAVMALPVHMPDDHPVCFDDFEDVEEIRQAVDKPTKLTAYFILILNHAAARQYRYYEIPEHYTWENREHFWRPRVQVAKMFGCMVEVSPLELEKWCLRLLLSHVSGATSFENLRTVQDIEYETFEMACRARHLLHNIDEYDRFLQEALMFRTPKGFRKLFALICCIAAANVLGQIPILWERHRADLMEDYLEQYDGDEVVAELRALMEIADVLTRNGNFTLQPFGLPPIDQQLLEFHELPPNNHKEVVFADFAGDESLLNEEKNEIYRLVMSAINDKIEGVDAEDRANMLYVDAPGGTGKTFLFNTILKNLRNRLFHTVAVAWTGIAASLLLAGKTVHRAFKLSLNITEHTLRCGFPMSESLKGQII